MDPVRIHNKSRDTHVILYSDDGDSIIVEPRNTKRVHPKFTHRILKEHEEHVVIKSTDNS